MGDWLEALGLERLGEPNDSYVMYAARGGEHGYVGLHNECSDNLAIVGGPAAVHLTFCTGEPLDDVARRLVESGYGDAAVSRQEFGEMLTVTDTDGQQVQVHEAPQPA